MVFHSWIQGCSYVPSFIKMTHGTFVVAIFDFWLFKLFCLLFKRALCCDLTSSSEKKIRSTWVLTTVQTTNLKEWKQKRPKYIVLPSATPNIHHNHFRAECLTHSWFAMNRRAGQLHPNNKRNIPSMEKICLLQEIIHIFALGGMGSP